ncbi:hypothetical protein [Cryptosporangium aurantiacum]|uniref:Uncharacterized protein n=1 Tax=Cryptosporangium aurantiacum TaxID=134849 RepID=A0A1M7JHW0_9ACTN|nr:hypothetical protein [Cryptosporangium aurantiacum]SHM52545.1 hypothetical protein SAMN05443668_101803 [Cryptosporangium aurantiacum]
MRLIIELSQTAQGRLEGSVARPNSSNELSFEGVVELVGVLEQLLRAGKPTGEPDTTPG